MNKRLPVTEISKLLGVSVKDIGDALLRAGWAQLPIVSQSFNENGSANTRRQLRPTPKAIAIGAASETRNKKPVKWSLDAVRDAIEESLTKEHA